MSLDHRGRHFDASRPDRHRQADRRRAAADRGTACASRDGIAARSRRRPAHRADRPAPAPSAVRAFDCTSARQAGRNQQAAAQRKPRLVRPALDLLRLVERAPAVEPPERDFRMDFEHARGCARIGAQQVVDLADSRRDHEELLRHLARRIGRRRARRAQAVAIIGRHRSRRATAPRTPTIAARRAAGGPRSPPRGRQGRCAPAARSACRPRSRRALPARPARRQSAARSRIRASPPSGPHERDDPAGRAAVDAGQPDVAASLAHRPHTLARHLRRR